ncbi:MULTISPECIES: SH3 domain-containing protein [unclassified Streptomyces]|uniref:SH3 domain-containing protein n=1 Tax=unclassified Streptomyces TaxID=2593676 RepID=UPI00344FE9A6
MTRVTARLAGGLLAIAGIAGLAVTAAPSAWADTGVTAWVQGNIRAQANTSSPPVGTVAKGQHFSAACWLEGEQLTRNGITNNKWVKLTDGRFIWAGLLKGNDTGGVPNHC